MKIFLTVLFCLAFMNVQAQNQSFYFGADLSYVNQMEDCGADYKYQDESSDPYSIFAKQGTNLVRVRLWLDPSWWQEPLDQPEGIEPFYGGLKDLKQTIQRTKDKGMAVMLGFQYSDFWADPGRQLVPLAWVDTANSSAALADSVYNYFTYQPVNSSGTYIYKLITGSFSESRKLTALK